jgi:hypothetical protein
MTYLISHFYEGGTADQYRATLKAVHPSDGLPAGQIYHAAGPCDGGWLVVAVWDSKESLDRFMQETLMPTLPTVEGGFAGAPQQRVAEVANLVAA